MWVFFNAKQFYRCIHIQLQEFLAFLNNSLSFLLRKVKLDYNQHRTKRPAEMWVFFSTKRLARCMYIQLRAPLVLPYNSLGRLLREVVLGGQLF